MRGFWIVPVNPYLVNCDYHQKEFRVSFKPLEGPGMCGHKSPASHSAGSADIWQQKDVCSHCLSECSELTHMKFLTR
jgi:hypothetical protein